MKIRLMGEPEEIEKAVAELQKSFDVQSVSKPYANRNDSGQRVYLDVQLKGDKDELER